VGRRPTLDSLSAGQWQWKSFVIRGLVSAVAALLMMSQIWCGPNGDGSKTREVERLLGTIPICPSMFRVPGTGSTTAKGSGASITNVYKTAATYEEVKAYYVRELDRDWAFEGETLLREWGQDLGERELVFWRRDALGYYLIIDFVGEGPAGGHRSRDGHTYDIAVWWYERGRPN
jgi:hypothetical protein